MGSFALSPRGLEWPWHLLTGWYRCGVRPTEVATIDVAFVAQTSTGSGNSRTKSFILQLCSQIEHCTIPQDARSCNEVSNLQDQKHWMSRKASKGFMFRREPLDSWDHGLGERHDSTCTEMSFLDAIFTSQVAARVQTVQTFFLQSMLTRACLKAPV